MLLFIQRPFNLFLKVILRTVHTILNIKQKHKIKKNRKQKPKQIKNKKQKQQLKKQKAKTKIK